MTLIQLDTAKTNRKRINIMLGKIYIKINSAIKRQHKIKICNIMATEILQLLITLVSPSSNIYRACFLQTQHMSLNGVVNVSVQLGPCIGGLLYFGIADGARGTGQSSFSLIMLVRFISHHCVTVFKSSTVFPSLQVFLHFFHTRADFF